MMLLPVVGAAQLYDFACWARQTVVALSVVLAHRPRPAAAVRARASCAAPSRGRRRRRGRCAGARCSRSTASLHVYERRPLPPAARGGAGARRALDRRPPGGRRLLGRDPAAVGVLADRAAPPRLSARPSGDAGAGSTGLERFTIEDERGGRRLEACQSPVWDTALALIALADAGVPARRPRAASAPPTGCSASRSCARGDWAVRRPAAARPAAGRSSSRTPTTPTSTTRPRSCSRCSAVDHPDRARVSAGDRARRRVARGDAELRRRLGRVRRRQLPARSSASCRSATSAR